MLDDEQVQLYVTGDEGAGCMLQVDGVHVTIASVQALRGLSLRLPAGRMVGLIGRNGAGKTTLMRTVMGHLQPSAGPIASTAGLGELPRMRAQRWASATCPKTAAWCPS